MSETAAVYDAGAIPVGARVRIVGRGPHGADTWQAVYLAPVGSGWCEIRRVPWGDVHRVPRAVLCREDQA